MTSGPSYDSDRSLLSHFDSKVVCEPDAVPQSEIKVSSTETSNPCALTIYHLSKP